MAISSRLQAYAIAVLFLTIVSTATAKYSGGSGTAQDPYQITTAADLIALGETPADYDKHFIMTADLDLDPNLPGRKVFDKAVVAPDTDSVKGGFQGTPFTSVFDGNGYTISHLTVTGQEYVGLFGRLASGAEVKDLRAVDINITASGYSVGGLVGDSSGDVTQCYSTGAVSGGEWAVGGLVGSNLGTVSACRSAGSVSGVAASVGGLVGSNSGGVTRSCSTCSVGGADEVGGLVGRNVTYEWYGRGSSGTYWARVNGCYATGAVSGIDHIGGLVGFNAGDITHCHCTGAVTGTGGAVGGLVGSINYDNVSYCVWDTQSSGFSGSAGGVGLTTAEMMDSYVLGLNGFASDPNWVLDAGRDYPRLAWEGMPGQLIPEPDIDWLKGSGTSQDPYRINTPDQLIRLGKASILWDRHFSLGADIDLNPALPNGQVFGQAVIPTFAGVFDGSGHAISNLVIEGRSDLGLFGRLLFNAEVRDLGVIDVNVQGSCGVGGLAGWNVGGRLVRCRSTGVIQGGSSLGGLLGSNDGRDVIQCYSAAVVTGTGQDVGTLIGSNGGYPFAYSSGGNVTDCYGVGAVSGATNVGGLVGQNRATITRCYSTGVVSGKDHVGGLVGFDFDRAALGCFWDTQTSGQTKSPAGTGKTTPEMHTAKTFLDAGWDFVGETKNGTEDIWWILEGKDYPKLWWESGEEVQADP